MRSNRFYNNGWKKCLVLLVFFFQSVIIIGYAQTPVINRIEYFLDSDPGYGNATNLSFTGTTNATGTINIDLLPLNQGVHIVGVRSRDANGAWSHDNRWLFVKPYNSSIATQPNINRVEWFLDTDPGYGNATALPIVAGQDIAGISFNIDLLQLNAGVHIVGVRSKDVNGAWSHDNRWLFVKPYSSSNAIQPTINRVEWFLDTDPGYGNATALPIASGQDIAGISFNIDMTPLYEGVHIVGVRSRDANGAWSHDNKWLFVKPYTTLSTTQPNINRVEWFLDTDPGYGNATALPISAGQDIAGLSFNINMIPLYEGVHIVGVRSRDVNGAWSHDNKWLFVKPYTTLSTTQPNINRVEWFLDTDPGYGNATPISISQAQDLSGLIINIPLTTLYKGVHIVGVRSRDANGAWSLDNKWLFLVPYTSSGPAPVPNITKMEYYVDIDPGFGRANSITITPGTDIGALVFDADITTVMYGAHKLGIRSLDANGAWSLDNKVDFTGGTGTSWIGVTSTDWTTGSNWSKGLVPTATDHVTIPTGTPFYPVIKNGVTGLCKSIKIYSTATVTVVTGGNLKVGQ